MSRFVVAYDVSSDRQRLALAALLGRFGVRIQYSVFDCEMEGDALENVLPEITSLLEPGLDRVHVLRQCESCLADRKLLGAASSPLQELAFIV